YGLLARGVVGGGDGVGGQTDGVARRVRHRAGCRSQAISCDPGRRDGLGRVPGTVVAGERRVAVRVGDQRRLVVGGVGRRGGVAPRVLDRRLVAVRVVSVAGGAGGNRRAAACPDGDRGLAAIGVVGGDGG